MKEVYVVCYRCAFCMVTHLDLELSKGFLQSDASAKAWWRG